jgi:hypothetical protein
MRLLAAQLVLGFLAIWTATILLLYWRANG